MNNTLNDKIQEMEREAILIALEECLWVQARAARKLGITERKIGYKIKKYGIEIKEENNGESKVSNSDVDNQQDNKKY